MKRINVIGTTGSGKTTFSKELSTALGIPYVQLDELFWKPNWVSPRMKSFCLK
jgi:adenylate kinase family enzyme